VLACFHVVVKMYQYSLEERVSIVKTYWITGSIKNCQWRFVEQFGGRNPPSKCCIQLLVAGCVAVSFRVDYLYLYLIFSCCQLPFCEFPKRTTALHYRYDMRMYCTFVPFVNQHFPGLPASGTHCIRYTDYLCQCRLRTTSNLIYPAARHLNGGKLDCRQA
jgi:hypothetical protein